MEICPPLVRFNFADLFWSRSGQTSCLGWKTGNQGFETMNKVPGGKDQPKEVSGASAAMSLAADLTDPSSMRRVSEMRSGASKLALPDIGFDHDSDTIVSAGTRQTKDA
jgi:hypothetical protein